MPGVPGEGDVIATAKKVRDRCDLADAAFDWCLQNGLEMERAGNAEHAAQWAGLAGWTAFRFGYSYLSSEPLESLLWRLGRRMGVGGEPVARRAGTQPATWLHVFTQTGEIGGHAAIARRWIEHNPFSERHNLVLTHQDKDSVQSGLARSVECSGGSIVSLAGEKSLLARALQLRAMARSGADVVVLHAHPFDVVPSLAFAAGGGPPVLLVNHADHAFWTGAAVADLVVDIRDSGRHLTGALRGVRRSALLPVPLPDAGRAPKDRSRAAARLQNPALLERELVLLTIGGGRKYAPVPGLSFPDAVRRIVEEVPECVVIAVGPGPERPRWRQLHADTGGRVVAVGTDPDLGAWHAAADLYLEGFPIGSYTALLEVALAGRSFVRKPYLVSPSVLPVDRGALAAFDPPETADAYVASAVALCRDPAQREAQATRARASVVAAHCGEGWAASLEALRKQVPARHESPGAQEAGPMPAELRDYWGAYYARQAPGNPLDHAAARAAELGLTPAAVPGAIPGVPDIPR